MKQSNHSLAIIGGGQCGTMFLHDLLCQLEKKKQPGAAVNGQILWIEKTGRFGHADAFNPRQSPSLLMNGPTYMLSPSLARPRLFQDFYNQAAGDNDHGSFIARHHYGDFLAALPEALERQARAMGIQINKIQGTVQSIERQKQAGLQIRMGTGMTLDVSSIALAMGPAKNHKQDHLQGQQGYIANPSRLDNFINSTLNFKNPATAIACFGPGASCFDGMALLENELAYKGKYIVVGHRDTPLWVINRQQPVPPDVHFKPIHISASKLPCPLTLTQLEENFALELLSLEDTERNPYGMGPEYPLFALAAYGHQIFKLWVKHHEPDALARAQAKSAFDFMQQKALKTLESTTSPQMLSLYNSLKAQGRILEVDGRVQEQQVRKPDHLFTVPVIRRKDGLKLNYRCQGFMNARPYSRQWPSPATPLENLTPPEALLARMEQQGLIHRDEDNPFGLFAAKSGDIALLGAAADPLWGVHLAALRNGMAAEHFADKLLRHNPGASQPKAMPSP